MSHPPHVAPGIPGIPLDQMPQRAEIRSTDEDWTGVTSRATRRRLQNRLNQRTYRKRRLAEKGGTAPEPDEKPVPLNTLTALIRHHDTPRVPVCTSASPRARAELARFASRAYASYVSGSPDLTHLSVLVQFNVASALAQNASLLGVSAAWLTYDAISPFNLAGPGLGSRYAPPDFPASLRPTALQGVAEHHPWIDLFPHPRMRDNLLRAIEDPEVCDEDELCFDLCQVGETGDDGGKATLVVWGPPWDARSWEASVPFLRKWGWLLRGCDEVLEATNYWRERRGAGRVGVAGLMGGGGYQGRGL